MPKIYNDDQTINPEIGKDNVHPDDMSVSSEVRNHELQQLEDAYDSPSYEESSAIEDSKQQTNNDISTLSEGEQREFAAHHSVTNTGRPGNAARNVAINELRS